MNDVEQTARILAAEVRNGMNAKALYDLQQQVLEQEKRIASLTSTPPQVVLVKIGNRLFNPAHIIMVWLSTQTATIELAVQDGDGPREITFRDADRLCFLEWLKDNSVAPLLPQ